MALGFLDGPYAFTPLGSPAKFGFQAGPGTRIVPDLHGARPTTRNGRARHLGSKKKANLPHEIGQLAFNGASPA